MFQTINGFLQSWEYEAEATQRVLDVLTDESLQREVTSKDRTLGRIAWHIVTAIPVLMSHTELTFAAPSEDEPVPASAQVIADSYRQVNTSFIQALKTHWTDDSLKMMNDVFGRKMPNGIFLMILIRHQVHHRGQMTILMRQAGLKVPGIYGPSREEWADMGMDVPLI
jgi:uncharacterized damage-inducible protein DinB